MMDRCFLTRNILLTFPVLRISGDSFQHSLHFSHQISARWLVSNKIRNLKEFRRVESFKESVGILTCYEKMHVLEWEHVANKGGETPTTPIYGGIKIIQGSVDALSIL